MPSDGLSGSLARGQVDDGANNGTRSFLRSDLSIECNVNTDARYAEITFTATWLVALWPVGTPFLFLLMLLPIRRDLMQR